MIFNVIQSCESVYNDGSEKTMNYLELPTKASVICNQNDISSGQYVASPTHAKGRQAAFYKIKTRQTVVFPCLAW